MLCSEFIHRYYSTLIKYLWFIIIMRCIKINSLARHTPLFPSDWGGVARWQDYTRLHCPYS